MTAVEIIGCAVLGVLAGGIFGMIYGEAKDKSDLPLLPVFTTPFGAVLGGLAGTIIGSVIFT